MICSRFAGSVKKGVVFGNSQFNSELFRWRLEGNEENADAWESDGEDKETVDGLRHRRKMDIRERLMEQFDQVSCSEQQRKQAIAMLNGNPRPPTQVHKPDNWDALQYALARKYASQGNQTSACCGIQ